MELVRKSRVQANPNEGFKRQLQDLDELLQKDQDYAALPPVRGDSKPSNHVARRRVVGAQKPDGLVDSQDSATTAQRPSGVGAHGPRLPAGPCGPPSLKKRKVAPNEDAAEEDRTGVTVA